jgi:hypothetical protein
VLYKIAILSWTRVAVGCFIHLHAHFIDPMEAIVEFFRAG